MLDADGYPANLKTGLAMQLMTRLTRTVDELRAAVAAEDETAEDAVGENDERAAWAAC